MRRPIRLLITLSALITVSVLLWRRYARGPWESTPQPTWPPLEPAVTEPVIVEPAVTGSGAGSGTGLEWVAPTGGACPDSHPIKANPRSMVFHVPGGRSYDRTQAGRCYPTTEAAQRDGYRQAKA